ncbi:MAG: fumarylacetoacetate hydrolase family protein [Actinomycetota bacterium]|nr:fumarylacetoacetate hydrolase family protein [Actinomycetota bacterium]
MHELTESLDELVRGATPTPTGRTSPVDPAMLAAPLPESCRGLLCTGINYLAHQEESAAEFSADVPTDPIFFFKTVSAVADPCAELPLGTGVSEQFDWEVELGVVIGTGGRDIAVEDAAEHIFGYTVVNDITARDLQKRHQQWLLGKNVDASTPVGPWIVTADEVAFPPAFPLSLEVNGETMQKSDTTLMIFGIAEQISILSRSMTLEPGDVISTGTPSGVGFTRTPPVFLAEGDVVEATVDGVGVLRNIVRTGSAPTTAGAVDALVEGRPA